MKSLVKNIVIAAEFVIIAVLLAAVIRLYPEKRNAVETALLYLILIIPLIMRI